MTTTIPTRDQLAAAACDWMRNRGLRNYQFSVQRHLGHYHMVDGRFDMNHLSAIAFPGAGGYTIDVVKNLGGVCPVCPEQARIKAEGGKLLWLDFIVNGHTWQVHDHLTLGRLAELGVALAARVANGVRITELHVYDEDAEDVAVPGFPLPIEPQ